MGCGLKIKLSFKRKNKSGLNKTHSNTKINFDFKENVN